MKSAVTTSHCSQSIIGGGVPGSAALLDRRIGALSETDSRGVAVRRTAILGA